jgi:mevalonate kinase
MLISSAKSKLILAGEHAVLYGAPAITTQLIWQTSCQWALRDQGFLIQIANASALLLSQDELQVRFTCITNRHHHWQLNPHLVILRDLYDLPIAVLMRWQQQFDLPALSLVVHSDIPIGQGLGSSASLIIAMLRGLSELIGHCLTDQQLLSMATEIEHFAHGKSSGLDVAAIALSPRLAWHDGQAEPLYPFKVKGYLIDTGQAESSTAQCVAHVRQKHQSDDKLWLTFAQQVNQLTSALIEGREIETHDAVLRLQTLLVHIGVVPQKVQDFDAAVRALGWAGKLCGAGSVTGVGGGFYWLLSDQEPDQLCRMFGYRYDALTALAVSSYDY